MQNNTPIAMLVLVLCCYSASLTAQDSYVIRSVDKTTNQPIDGLEVWYEDSLIATSNFLGYFSAPGQPEDLWTLKHPSYFPQELVLPTSLKFQVKMGFKGDSLLFSEGLKDFYQQIAMKMRFPSAARNAGFQGTCMARLSIDQEGKTILEEVNGAGCKSVQRAIKDVFRKLDGSWDVSHAGEQIMMPFVFQIVGQEPPPPLSEPRDSAFKHFGAVTVTAQKIVR
ncbi:MAG: hypothetical protein R8G66_14845 [Cytophagales bacterium]|nr:hypothetical protein [Cytophagales bacterium]